MVAATLLFPLINSQASERVALVVGNGEYAHAPKLRNSIADARLVGAALGEAGFDVVSLENVGVDGFYEGLEQFKQRAASARVGLVYFAGHGIEVDGTNYLLPVDANLESAGQLRRQAISLDTVLSDLSDARLPAKLAILDCCRDNPLTRSWLSSRSAGRGLGPIRDLELPEATMVIYSAGPGQVAFDGEGANSPFTESLVTRLRQPGLNVWGAFTETSYDVAKATNRKQEPWVKVDGAGITFRELVFVPGGAGGSEASTSAMISPASFGESATTSGNEVGSYPAPVTMEDLEPIPMPSRGYFTNTEVFQRGPYESFNDSSKRRILRLAQEKLTGAGTPDGTMGTNTQDALVAYQSSKSLPTTGLLDLATLKSMDLMGLSEEGASTASSGRGSSSPSSRSYGSSGQKYSAGKGRGRGLSGQQVGNALKTIEQVSRIYRNFR